MVPGAFSPLQLFLSFGAIAAGSWLFAAQPGSRALVVLDWPRLLLLAALAAAALFAAERRVSRRLRREEPDAYPYRLAVAVVAFGLGAALVGAVNSRFARTPPRVLRPAVLGWESARQTVTAGNPYLPPADRREELVATVESWRRPGERLLLPVSVAAQEAAEGDGPHALEVIVADGSLGIEYVVGVRLVAR